ncbi:MAG: outer membrane beta-barrel protein [Dysgonamonadaceae bacterium]|nr:outer membrane beta-barrel protein [Dysgonamonadaceae bacterium]
MEEKWINNLREKMETHEQPEPSGLWDDIEVALNVNKSAPPIKSYKKVLLWSTIGTVAAMLMLIFFIGKDESSLLTTPANIEPQLAKQNIQESLTNQNNNNNIQQIEDKTPLLATNTTSYNKQQISNNNKEPIFVPISDEDEISERLENENIEEDQKDADNNQTESAKESQSEKKDYFPNGRANYGSIDNYNYRRTSKNRDKLTASLYSTSLPNTSVDNSGYGELIARATLPGQMSANRVEEQSFVGDIIYSNIGEETYTNTEHKQPIKAGLSIRYQLNDKFGIESGLTYTYLSSNLTSGTDKNLYETEQSLQYVGIPLNISYNVWDSKQLSFYATTGGVMEKCVDGKSHIDYIINNNIVSTDDEKIKDSPLQFSVNSSVGIQLNVTSKLGVFAEPGLAYYFNNGSPIETIYKEKPLNFNLKLGIRISFNQY